MVIPRCLATFSRSLYMLSLSVCMNLGSGYTCLFPEIPCSVLGMKWKGPLLPGRCCGGDEATPRYAFSRFKFHEGPGGRIRDTPLGSEKFRWVSFIGEPCFDKCEFR